MSAVTSIPAVTSVPAVVDVPSVYGFLLLMVYLQLFASLLRQVSLLAGVTAYVFILHFCCCWGPPVIDISSVLLFLHVLPLLASLIYSAYLLLQGVPAVLAVVSISSDDILLFWRPCNFFLTIVTYA